MSLLFREREKQIIRLYNGDYWSVDLSHEHMYPVHFMHRPLLLVDGVFFQVLFSDGYNARRVRFREPRSKP
jgi:hypothetical protein